MEDFLIFVDDTGNVYSETEKKIFGLGFFICPKDLAEQIESRFVDMFPKGIHMKDLRGVKRKSFVLKRLVDLLIEFPQILCGSSIQTDLGLIRRTLVDSTLRILEENPDAAIDYFINAAPHKTGVVLLDDIFGNLINQGRSMGFISNLIRLPMMNLIKTFKLVDKFNVTIMIAAPVSVERFERDLLNSRNIFDIFEGNFPSILKKVGCPNVSINATLKAVESKSSPLFDIADAFAWVGREIASALLQNLPLPKAFSIAEPVLSRSAYGQIPGILIMARERAIFPE